MARAIEVSRQHTGLTDTNPSVGCVLVKDGEIIAEAVTSIGGRPHAERNALAIAGEAARGATAYVTLEPCSHYGKTPPCANALVDAGLARVVVAVDDPDERVSGRGYQILRDAGITVETGLLREEGTRALAGYLTRKINNRPHVILKIAVSADGMIGKRGAGQVAITGLIAREAVHRLRAECDAILVGICTALADDPELNVRIAGLEHRSPVRIVLDRRLELPLTSKLVTTARDVPVMVVQVGTERGTFFSPMGRSDGAQRGDEVVDVALRRDQLIAAGIEILSTPDLASLLHTLAERGMSELLVEGGATVARAFLDARLVDRILLLEGPGMIGEGGLESPLTRSDIPHDYVFVSETAYGPDRCFEFERPL